MIRNEKGFTLIELMVVVLIIGILVAVAIPVFGSAAERARDRACEANLRTLDGSLAQYESEFNTPAPSIASLETEQFLFAVPQDPHPPGGTTYRITGGYADTFDGHGGYR